MCPGSRSPASDPLPSLGVMSRSEKFARHSEPGAPNFGYPPQNVEAVASERAGLLFNLAHARQKRFRRARDMHRIVVVGGGVAGIVTATHLSRRLTRSKLADILLVDHNLAHVWKPMLHTFAAGTANYTNENISFISHAKRTTSGTGLGNSRA